MTRAFKAFLSAAILAVLTAALMAPVWGARDRRERRQPAPVETEKPKEEPEKKTEPARTTPAPPVRERVVKPPSPAEDRGPIESVIHKLSDPRFISGSRIAGYPGNEAAAQYVEDRFKEIGLSDVTSQYFDVVVPVQNKCSLSVSGKEYRIDSLWPNGVRTCSTPPEGITGPLVYCGTGELHEFNGRDINGAICLMEFDCGDNWQNAAMLGAEAVVFIAPEMCSRSEAASKFVKTSIVMRRFWISREAGLGLKAEAGKAGVAARLIANVTWEKRRTRNIIGFLPGAKKIMHGEGEKKREQCVMITAHFDSMSVVPAIAPGAEQAASIAALLDLAKYYRENRPGRTVAFVATNAHFLFYRGIRELAMVLGKTEENAKARVKEIGLLVEDYTRYGEILALKDHKEIIAKADEFANQGLQALITNELQTRMQARSRRAGELSLKENATEEELAERDFITLERVQLIRILNLFSQFSRADAWERLLPNEKDGPLESDRLEDDRKVFFKTMDYLRDDLAKRVRDLEKDRAHVLEGEKIRELFARYFIRLHLSLELSGGTSQFAFFPQGGCHSDTDEQLDIIYSGMAVMAKEIDREIGRGEETPFVNLAFEARGWSTFVPAGLGFESEFTLHAGLHALSVATVGDGRFSYDTPYDTFEAVRAGGKTGRLSTQVEFLRELVGKLADRNDLLAENRAQKLPGGITMSSIKGTAMTRSVSSGTVTGRPVTGALLGVRMTAGTAGTRASLCGVRGQWFMYSDALGEFRVIGLRNAGTYVVDAYQLDEATGEVTSAADRGTDGSKYPGSIRTSRFDHECKRVIFECGCSEFYFTVDARELKRLGRMTVLDGLREGVPREYGIESGSGESIEEPFGVVYLPPESAFKIIMKEGELGVRYLLLNSVHKEDGSIPSKKEAQGFGYEVADRRIVMTPYRAARDMCALNRQRIADQREKGITNERVDGVQVEAEKILEEAEKELEEKRYDRFMDRTLHSLALSTLVYNDVVATANDTLKGVVFYMLALLPFAFFFERLVFNAVKIHHRLALFFAVFVAMFFLLFFVHPAFDLTETPGIVPVAVVILSLAIIVISIVYTRFAAQMKNLELAERGIRAPDVSRGGAAFAGFMLGISNMRRRKVRTWLTCITVVLITFTMLSFVSLVPKFVAREVVMDHPAPYEGLFVRGVGWGDIDPVELDVLRNAFPDDAVAPRAWMTSAERGEFSSIDLVSDDGAKAGRVRVLFGLTEAEDRVFALSRKIVTAGRWLRKDDRYVCLLPKEVAGNLGVGPGQFVRLYGRQFEVVGTFDGDALGEIRDLNNGFITPVSFSMTAEERQKHADQAKVATEMIQQDFVEGDYTHMRGQDLAVIPYVTAMSLGGTLKSIAVSMSGKGAEDIEEEIGALVQRLSLTVYAGIGGKTSLMSSKAGLSVGGAGSLAIPLAIAGLIILNTMLGAVYERRSEIGTYSSVGLAPLHVASLFIAEALVYAVVGAMVGYLLGQTVVAGLERTNTILAMFGWDNPIAGLSQNYSSLSVVGVLLAVMSVVLMSVAYPAMLASKLSTPDVDRRWDIPSAEGDEVLVRFPFTYNKVHALAVMAFINEFFRGHLDSTIGEFHISGIEMDEIEKDGRSGYMIGGRVWLAPFDLGVSQDVEVYCFPDNEEDVYEISLWIRRHSGYDASWERLNVGFLDRVRKQFLIWHTVSDDDKKTYTDKGKVALDGYARG